MVHFGNAFSVAKAIKEKEEGLEESFFKGLEDMVKRDQVKQKIKIQNKLATGKKLTSFEKWFVTTPEYQSLRIENINSKKVNN